VYQLRITRVDGTVRIVDGLDHETADRLARLCRQDPDVREAVAVAMPSAAA
jgi:hypothetical protein